MFEQQGRVDVIEGQVGLADLGQFSVEPMTTPRDGKISSCRQDQMDIGWKQICEATQIGDEDGIRQVVEVVEDDDHLGEIDQLGLECFEQWRTEAATVQGHQGGEVGKVWVHAGKAPKQSLGEADGVVVVDADFHPDKIQLRMGICPLSEENRFSCSGRSHDQGQCGGEPLVQLTAEGRTINRVGRSSRWSKHN